MKAVVQSWQLVDCTSYLTLFVNTDGMQILQIMHIVWEFSLHENYLHVYKIDDGSVIFKLTAVFIFNMILYDLKYQKHALL